MIDPRVRLEIESRPAVVQQVERFSRCACPECLRLDRLYPGQGYQLALFQYRPAMIGTRP